MLAGVLSIDRVLLIVTYIWVCTLHPQLDNAHIFDQDKLITSVGEKEVHDLAGADALLPQMAAEILIADKAFDADDRVIRPLAAAGKSAVIPPKQNRTVPREFDQQLCKTRHLIENFFCKLKQFRAIATRYDKTATYFLAAIHLAAVTIWLN
jgi:transposase